MIRSQLNKVFDWLSLSWLINSNVLLMDDFPPPPQIPGTNTITIARTTGIWLSDELPHLGINLWRILEDTFCLFLFSTLQGSVKVSLCRIFCIAHPANAGFKKSQKVLECHFATCKCGFKLFTTCNHQFASICKLLTALQ